MHDRADSNLSPAPVPLNPDEVEPFPYWRLEGFNSEQEWSDYWRKAPPQEPAQDARRRPRRQGQTITKDRKSVSVTKVRPAKRRRPKVKSA